jgi:hypothetical protein
MPALAYQAYGIIDSASRIFYEIFLFFLTVPKPASNGVIRRFSICVQNKTSKKGWMGGVLSFKFQILRVELGMGDILP